MKHIKRKFLNEVKLERKDNEPPLSEVLRAKSVTTKSTNNATIPKDFIPFFITDDSIYTGFHVKINGKKMVVPEPDPHFSIL